MKKRLLSALLALCMVLTMLPGTVLADYAVVSGTIQGEVFDATSQTPVSATVAVYRQDDASTALASVTADTNGVFTIPLDTWFTSGNYTLVFSHSLYLSRSMEITVTSNDGLAISGGIGLYPVGKASGTVINASSGAALSGVSVNVYTSSKELKATTLTDTEGRYSIETESGVYDFEFVLTGYITARFEGISLGTLDIVPGSPIYKVQMTLGTSEGGGENSGDSENNWAWTLEDGILTIIGSGKMTDYRANATGAPWYDERGSIQQVIIEEGITSIGANAFYRCQNLTSVILPNSLTRIDDYAFSGCTLLTELIIPEGVTFLGNYIIQSTAIHSITIPSTVTTISRYGNVVNNIGALSGCSTLEEVIFAQGITKIPNYICAGSSIRRVFFPDSVEEIADYAFYACSNLSGMINIPSSTTSIGRYAFCQCTSVTSVSMPNSLTRIDDYAFSGCTLLTELIIPEGVTFLGNYIIQSTAIHSITIPSTVTTISRYGNVVNITFEKKDRKDEKDVIK